MDLLRIKSHGRNWQIDFFRGIAIILMVIFNYSFTLRYFNIYNIEGGWLYWYLFPRIIGGMFIFLAGFSVMMAYKKSKDKTKSINHGITIFFFGLIVTSVTWILFPRDFIIFGILHLIGLSIILSRFFFRFRHKLFLGIGLFIAGLYLQNLTFDFQ